MCPLVRILFVDDNEDTCVAMTLLLGISGYEVMPATTAAEGLSLAKRQHFSLYILDNQLPDGTGIELCRQIRTFDARTPILFCSGAVEEAEQQRALAAGAQAYLTKPGEFDALEPTIARLLKRSGAGAAGKE